MNTYTKVYVIRQPVRKPVRQKRTSSQACGHRAPGLSPGDPSCLGEDVSHRTVFSPLTGSKTDRLGQPPRSACRACRVLPAEQTRGRPRLPLPAPCVLRCACPLRRHARPIAPAGPLPSLTVAAVGVCDTSTLEARGISRTLCRAPC